MDSFTKVARFIYNPNANQESEDALSGILEIHVHHARNIHNICIYDKQDVYAKFSLTYNPDETLSTRIINGGGQNPDFNEDLIMKIHQMDAVLKCEIWMMSRAKSYMDDQLLGFALVPISSVFGKGKVTQDFDLSSTDLFHSPAGTIKLSLSLNAKTTLGFADLTVDHDDDDDTSSKTSELLDKKIIPEEYCRLEFPDMNVVNENQEMVSQYFAKNGRNLLRPWLEKADGSFLHLGAPPDGPVEDCEMANNSSNEYRAGSISPDGSIQNSGFLSSTMTSLSDDRNSDDNVSPIIVETPTSNKKSEENDAGVNNEKMSDAKPVGLVRNIKLEAEESVMQQQIVDMYMRSMQQFTESLAKMKLPMDLDKPEIDNQGDLIQNPDKKIEVEKKKKDNSRVFYGSRAFF